MGYPKAEPVPGDEEEEEYMRPSPGHLNYSRKSKLKTEIESPLGVCLQLLNWISSVTTTFQGHLPQVNTQHNTTRPTRVMQIPEDGRNPLTWFLRHSKWCDFLHPCRRFFSCFCCCCCCSFTPVVLMVNGYSANTGTTTLNSLGSTTVIPKGCGTSTSSGTWFLEFNSIFINIRFVDG